MLAIRMQRIGRSGHAHFRVIVQDSRWSPKSGKFVAALGSYDPHTKTTTLVKNKAETYLNNGAQPSDRVARLFKSEGIKLPKWVELEAKKKGTLRNPEKLRKNRPADTEPKAEKPVEEPAETETKVEEQSTEEVIETKAKAEEPTAEAAAEEPKPSEEAPTESETPTAEEPKSE